MYVPFFRCESFPYISRRADWFPCALFPFHSPCISVPFMSLSVPLCFPFISPCFPVMLTSYFLPSFPCTSLHFPFLPSISRKTRGFSSVFAKRTKKTEFFQIFGKRRQEPLTSKEPAGGIEPGTPVLRPPRRLRLVERHQIAARSGGGGWRRRNPASRGGLRGGGYPLFSLKYPTRRTMSADLEAGIWQGPAAKD